MRDVKRDEIAFLLQKALKMKQAGKTYQESL